MICFCPEAFEYFCDSTEKEINSLEYTVTGDIFKNRSVHKLQHMKIIFFKSYITPCWLSEDLIFVLLFFLQFCSFQKIKFLSIYIYICSLRRHQLCGEVKLTVHEPLTTERRFLQTGSNIIRQLKLRTAALALAKGRANYKSKNKLC